jgi:FKBP-type peptidyl-prolyl cis-trans isomerase FkpA
MQRIILAVSVTALLGACGQSQPAAETETDSGDGISFGSDDERVLYALGIALGENIAEFTLSEDELDLVAAGMRDVIADAPYQVDMELYGNQIQRLANERAQAALEAEKAASAAFADEIAAEAGAERTASGIVYISIAEGDGASPAATDLVRVHYHGTFLDGDVFDSSLDGEPAEFGLNEVISCWTEGVQKMQVGGKARLFCPSDTAYGDSGRPGIPAGAGLLFEVELLDIL